jgi:hypothetical protein
MPVDQAGKRVFIERAVAKWRDQRHNRTAEHCANPSSRLRLR